MYHVHIQPPAFMLFTFALLSQWWFRMAVSKTRTRRQKVFRSVFEPEVSQPTPLLPSTEPGEPFGGPVASTHHHQTPPASDQVRWDRAWHVVTANLQLPSSVAAEDSFGSLLPDSENLDPEFANSLSLVLNPRDTLPHASHTEDLLAWHTQQVRHHFVNHVLPLLAACEGQGSNSQVLFSSVRTLEAAHRQYLFVLRLVVGGFKDETEASSAVARFRRDLHAVVGNSWTQGLLYALRQVLQNLVGTVLDVEEFAGGGTPAEARDELLGLIESLHKVGLAGERFQVLLAEVMDDCMTKYIHGTFAGVWTKSDDAASGASSGCMSSLSDWVEDCYGRLAVEIFSRLCVHIDWSDVDYWKEVAVGRLATLRINELFDIVLHWPESRGGIEDLRSAVVTPQRRLQLTDVFSATMQKRLLHPGRSTLDILRIYISMIRAFHVLDHSKVLLDRVVHALQLYLCQRDDAIRIVVTGLLSNPVRLSPEGKSTKTLVELATLLNDASQKQRRQIDDDELDWDDMTWVPDPVDAGVNYKRPKNEDVIGSLIGALGSQDIFIKEFQSIIAERLLSAQSGFQQEVKVLGLLKKRFGENALQSCDVMIKDIQDSKRVDTSINKAMLHQPGTEDASATFHAKILSRLFWPSLPKEPFNIPRPIAKVQSEYEAGFEQLKSSRKLNWLNQIGSVTVQLDLQDRSLSFECKTYEAAVIYAFQEEGDDSLPQPLQKTFLELWEQLMIDEDLLESALKFWMSERILRDIGNQTYIVLETLEEGDDGLVADRASILEGEEGSQPSPRKVKVDAKEQERRTVYWQFVVGMLTNSSPAMPLGQISMMMKMLIADGCPWSNEELQEFLGEKIAEQQLELVGGKYRLPPQR
jgi:anaphase-promoting complex subunit 2